MKYKLSTIVLPGNKAITFYFKNKKRDVTKTLTFSDTHPNFQLALAWLNNTRQSELFLEKRKVYEEDAENLFGLYEAAPTHLPEVLIFKPLCLWSVPPPLPRL